MGQNGGARPGAGRPKNEDRERTKKAILKAITEKFGSLIEGIKFQLGPHGNERVQYLIWQHVLGNPEVETKVKLSNHKGEELNSPIVDGKLIVEVVRTIHNQSTPVNGNQNDDSTRLPDVLKEENNSNAGGDEIG